MSSKFQGQTKPTKKKKGLAPFFNWKKVKIIPASKLDQRGVGLLSRRIANIKIRNAMRKFTRLRDPTYAGGSSAPGEVFRSKAKFSLPSQLREEGRIIWLLQMLTVSAQRCSLRGTSAMITWFAVPVSPFCRDTRKEKYSSGYLTESPPSPPSC